MLKSKLFFLLSATALAASLPSIGCGGGDEEETTPVGTAGAGGGKAGSSGKAGTGGSTAGTGGTAGKGGAGAGGAGAAGKGGAGAGQGGGGAAGKGGGGSSGKGGGAGAGGAGAGGASGKGGAGGAGAGGAGQGGAAGKGGAGAGGAGAGGAGAGGAGAGGAGAGGAGAGGAGAGGGGSTGSTPVATVSTAAVDFGLADCGGAAPGDQTVTIQNTGTGTLTVSAAVSGSNAFTVKSGATLSIAAGQSGSVVVSAAAVPASATAGVANQGTLTLTTNDSTKPSIAVTLKETPQGGTLVWTTPASGSADLGSVSVGQTGTQNLVLTNTGNADVSVTFGAPTDADFAVAPAAATNVPAGGTMPGLMASYTPTGANGAESATSAITATGALCGTSVSSLALSGTGVTGAVAYSSSALDFGLNPCGGAAAAAQTITITNSGSGAFNFTTTSGTTGGYTVTPASGSVAAGDTAIVTVTPSGIPAVSAVPGNYGDSFTITTDIAGDTPQTVTVTQSAQGAIITATTPAAFSTPVNTTANNTFNIVNTGNAGADVSLTYAGDATLSVSPASVTLAAAGAAGDTQSATASFAPTTFAPQAGTVTLGSASVLCQPLPAAVALSGTGLDGGISTDTDTVDFSLVPCGSQAQNKTFTITNPGNVAINWTSTVTNNGQSAFSMDVNSGTIPPGGSQIVTVTPGPVPAAPLNGVAALTGSVLITTDAVNNNTKTVNFSVTPQGGILAWNPGLVDFGNVSVPKNASKNGTLVNTGNVGVVANLALTGGSSSNYSVQATTNAAVGSTDIPVSFTASSAGSYFGGVAVTSPSGLCAPLPAPLDLVAKATIGAYSDNGTTWTFQSSAVPGKSFCGSKAPDQTLQVCNSSANGATQPFNITVPATSVNGLYTLTPSATTVPLDGCVNIVMSPLAIPSKLTKDVNGNYVFDYNDTFEISNDIPGDPNSPYTYKLNQGAYGAIITSLIGTGANPSAWSFADTEANKTSQYNYTVTNIGNLGAQIDFALTSGGANFGIAPIFASPGITPGVATFTPTGVQAYAGGANYAQHDPTVFCEDLPANATSGITLAGNGIAVSAASYGMSPSSLTYGAIPISDPNVVFGAYCGGPAGTKTVSLGNTTGVAVAYSTAFTSGSAFYTATPVAEPCGAGFICANSSVTINITGPTLAITDVPGTTKNGVFQATIGGIPYSTSLTTVVAGTQWQWLNGTNAVISQMSVGTTQATAGQYQGYNHGNATIEGLLMGWSTCTNGCNNWFSAPFAAFTSFNLAAEQKLGNASWTTANNTVQNKNPINPNGALTQGRICYSSALQSQLRLSRP